MIDTERGIYIYINGDDGDFDSKFKLKRILTYRVTDDICVI